MENERHPQFILVSPYKSVAGSIFLTIFLGPIGLLYSTFWGSIVMLFLTLIATVLLTMSAFYFWSVWFVCTYVGVIAVNRYNKKLYNNYFNVVQIEKIAQPQKNTESLKVDKPVN